MSDTTKRVMREHGEQFAAALDSATVRAEYVEGPSYPYVALAHCELAHVRETCRLTVQRGLRGEGYLLVSGLRADLVQWTLEHVRAALPGFTVKRLSGRVA